MELVIRYHSHGSFIKINGTNSRSSIDKNLLVIVRDDGLDVIELSQPIPLTISRLRVTICRASVMYVDDVLVMYVIDIYGNLKKKVGDVFENINLKGVSNVQCSSLGVFVTTTDLRLLKLSEENNNKEVYKFNKYVSCPKLLSLYTDPDYKEESNIVLCSCRKTVVVMTHKISKALDMYSEVCNVLTFPGKSSIFIIVATGYVLEISVPDLEKIEYSDERHYLTQRVHQIIDMEVLTTHQKSS